MSPCRNHTFSESSVPYGIKRRLKYQNPFFSFCVQCLHVTNLQYSVLCKMTFFSVFYCLVTHIEAGPELLGQSPVTCCYIIVIIGKEYFEKAFVGFLTLPSHPSPMGKLLYSFIVLLSRNHLIPSL